MNLLLVTHFFEAHRGGIEIVAGRMARELTSRGHKLTWAAADTDTSPEIEGVEPLRLKTFNTIEKLTGLPMPLPLPGAMRSLAQSATNADAVIIHEGLYATSVTALIAAKRARKPIILVQHISLIPFASRILRLLMRIADWLVTRSMIKAADGVIYISETTASHYRQVRTRRDAQILFNGVDTELFAPAPEAVRTTLRDQLGLASSRSALFVGRFVEKKGLSVLEQLARARPDIQFLLAGWGPIRPERWNLPNVRVIVDAQGSRLVELYNASDVFVIPSVGEGFPLVVQEALACDLPVICGTETAAADSAAANFVTGVRIDLADSKGSAARVNEALDGALSAPRDGRRALFARNRYSWKRVGDALDEILRDMAPQANEERK